MADRFQKLMKILRGTKGRGKVPTEGPGQRAQRRAFDTFARSSQAIFQQSLVGGAERQERARDYDQMDQTPEITQALNIYADDSVTYSEEGDVLDIISDDEEIVEALEELYYDRMNIDFHLWQWIRNMCKYGDNFLLLDVVEKDGILGVIQLPTLEIDREEGYNGDPNSVRFKWTSQGNTTFENYQISHFRIMSDDQFLPYGRSVLEAGRRIWKQLSMAEDAMLIYRFTRAPERRVFYIDVGNAPPKDVETYIMQARDKLKRTPLITESSGAIDYRFDPESIMEDFFLATRGGDRGSRIETLGGGTNINDIEDIEYLQNKLFIALGVPKTYLTAESDLGSKGSLAQEDIKFARTIQRIQKIAVSELAKIGLVHLYLKGFDEEKIYNFDLQLTNPSTVMEMMQLDLVDKRFDIASRMADSKLVDDYYVQKNVLMLSDHEISEINARILDDARKESLIEKLREGPEEEESGFGGFGQSNQDEDKFSETDRNPTKVPDPAGVKDIPGAKGPSEATIDDEEDSNDFELFLKKTPRKKKKMKDPFDKKISDMIKVNEKANIIFENIRSDIENGSISITSSLKNVIKKSHTSKN